MKQLLASIAVALGLNWPAAAAVPCYPRDALVQRLLNYHQEKPVVRGLASNGGLLELFAKEDGSTWTMVMTSPQGLSCVIGVGNILMIIEKEEPSAWLQRSE